jgi:hypothetical protein
MTHEAAVNRRDRDARIVAWFRQQLPATLPSADRQPATA